MCDHYQYAPGFVFIGGGIGIAPIMSMLRTLADRRDSRPLRLIYGNRRWDDVVFREELKDLSSRLDLTIVHVLQEPPADWLGLSGILNESVMFAALEMIKGGIYFVCGPKAMSDSVAPPEIPPAPAPRHACAQRFDLLANAGEFQGVGYNDGRRTEIRSGLSTGDTVVVHAQRGEFSRII